MITAAGNCSNCQHPVNSHPRRPTGGFTPASAPPVVAAATAEPSIQKTSEYQGQGHVVYASAIRLESHSTDNIPVYDTNRGGYVTGTGVQGDLSGNYNNYGNSGVGVNNTPQEIGTVAYGGALGAPYGNDPYSVTRNGRSLVHPPPQQTVSSTDYSSPYGNDPYSVKRR